MDLASGASWGASAAISAGMVLFGGGLLALRKYLVGPPRPDKIRRGEILRRDPVLGDLPAAERIAEACWTRREPVIHFARPPVVRQEYSPERIRSLAGHGFAELCRQFFESRGGLRARRLLGVDAGILLRLDPDAADKETAVVLCEASTSGEIGLGPLLVLQGAMVHEKAGKAFCVTRGRYSKEAKAFAAPRRITLIDGGMLLLMFQRLPTTDCQQPPAVVTPPWASAGAGLRQAA